MSNKEQLAADLRNAGIEFEETESRIIYKTEHWVINCGFRPDGSLEYMGHGNLAAVRKLEVK